MLRSISLFVLLLGSVSLYAQNGFESDFKFIKHLESLAAYEEGVHYIGQIQTSYTDRGRQDTLYYYKGKFEYYLRNRLDAVGHLTRVSTTSAVWVPAQFYGGLQNAYLGDYVGASRMFNNPESLTDIYAELRKYELSAVALLKRDYAAFEEISQEWDPSYFQLKDHQEILSKTFEEMKSAKKKSPFVAGLMSAVVPGTGKFYVGRFGQGTMSLLTCGIMGAQAYEGYRKGGLKSPGFIIFGSLFSAFYVANIWGSVVAVRVEQTSFNESMNETILLHMHIPLRLLFQ